MKKDAMPKYTIYHNPRCSTSRKALALLREAGVEPHIVEYLKQVPSVKDLEGLVAKLGLPAEGLLRKKEALYKEEYQGRQMSDQQWIRVMHEHPRLIERPVVIKGDKAVIGRPLENVKELMDKT